VSYNYDCWLLCPEKEERNKGEGKEMQAPWCTQTIVFMRTQGWHAAQRRECKTEKRTTENAWSEAFHAGWSYFCCLLYVASIPNALFSTGRDSLHFT
jgi:hypothetical protein